MAGVAKRLRPRIVVPICVGSNPITRPIFKRRFKNVFLIAIVAFELFEHFSLIYNSKKS